LTVDLKSKSQKDESKKESHIVKKNNLLKKKKGFLFVSLERKEILK